MAFDSNVIEALDKFMKVVNKKEDGEVESPSRRGGLGPAVETAKRASSVTASCSLNAAKSVKTSAMVMLRKTKNMFFIYCTSSFFICLFWKSS
jgi:hypothetical protein